MQFFRKSKILFSIVPLILFYSVAFSAEDNTAPNSEEKPAEENSPVELPEVKQEVYTFRVEGFSKEKKLEWGLEGKSASVVLDKVNITSLIAVYYSGDVTFNLAADKAVYDKTTHDVELMSNIVGTSSDGGELFTDYAKWRMEDEEITTDSYVVVKRENIICKGRGLVTRPKLKWVSFKKDIEVDFGEDKKITCDGPFEIDHEKNVAIFNTNVKVTDPKSSMLTDKLTVFLNPATKEIENVLTEGNVRIIHTGGFEGLDKLKNISFKTES